MTYQLKLASLGLALAVSAAAMAPLSTAANAGGWHASDRDVIVVPAARKRAWRRHHRIGRPHRRWRRDQRWHARRHHRHYRDYYVEKKRIGPGAVAVGLGALLFGLIIADSVKDHHH